MSTPPTPSTRTLDYITTPWRPSGSDAWLYQATWKTESGEVLHRHEGRKRERFVWHFYLLWATPINLATVPASIAAEKKMWRRLIAQVPATNPLLVG